MFWCDKRCYFASSCRKGIKKREETTAIKTITLARWYHCSFDFNSRRKSLWMAARCDWNKIKTIAAIHLTGLAGRSLPAFFFFYPFILFLPILRCCIESYEVVVVVVFSIPLQTFESFSLFFFFFFYGSSQRFLLRFQAIFTFLIYETFLILHFYLTF